MSLVTSEDLSERLERARLASQQVLNGRPMKVLEPPKAEPEQVSEPVVTEADMKNGFAVDNKSRFRRF